MKKLSGLLLFIALIFCAATAAAGNRQSDARIIEVNADYSSKLSSYDDRQYYRFELPSPGVVSISFSHEFVDSNIYFWQVRIRDEAENDYAILDYQGSSAGEETSFHTGFPAGTYYIRISPPGSHYSEAPFSFRVNYSPSDFWEAEPNDHEHMATLITTNTEFSGTTWSYDDKDYFCFALPSDGFISLSFSHDFVDSGRNHWYAIVMNEEGQVLLNKDYAGNNSNVSISNNAGVPAGTYFLKVCPVGSSGALNVDYTLKVNFTASDVWEKEFNDNMVSVNPISLNTDYSASILSSDDKDYFSFVLPAAGSVSIRFDHEYIDSGNDLWALSLRNEDEEEYYRTNYSGNALKASESNHIGLPAGTYYIRVAPCTYWSSDDYSFSVQYNESDEWEKEFNNNPHNANPIDQDTEMNGSIVSWEDEDYYRFVTPADGFLNVEFNHAYIDTDAGLWMMNILDEDGKVLDTLSFAGNADGPQTAVTAEMPAGTYFVQVRGGSRFSSDDYSFLLKYTDRILAEEPEAAPESETEPKADEVSIWVCPECGYENDTRFCVKCGTPKPEAIVCPGCGTVYNPDSGTVFCGNCGTKLQ